MCQKEHTTQNTSKNSKSNNTSVINGGQCPNSRVVRIENRGRPWDDKRQKVKESIIDYKMCVLSRIQFKSSTSSHYKTIHSII